MQLHVLPALLLLTLAQRTLGLRCYTCSVTENDPDTSCVDDVTSLGDAAITDCDKKYCTIARLDYIDPKGKLSSMVRNCVDKVPADGVTEDSTFRTYQRSCKTDLCNSGSGKSDTSDGRMSFGDKSTIYVPGIGSKSAGRILYAPVISLLIYLLLLRIF